MAKGWGRKGVKMTIKIEAMPHELEKIENLARMVDTVLDGGDSPSWRDVMYEVQEMLTEAELCEAEPLIKDDKIRKAVRAWAEANNTERVAIQNSYCLSAEGDENENIVFAFPFFKDIDYNVSYTITELCGEEE